MHDQEDGHGLYRGYFKHGGPHAIKAESRAIRARVFESGSRVRLSKAGVNTLGKTGLQIIESAPAQPSVARVSLLMRMVLLHLQPLTRTTI